MSDKDLYPKIYEEIFKLTIRKQMTQLDTNGTLPKKIHR
jgi:hypothetical protein